MGGTRCHVTTRKSTAPQGSVALSPDSDSTNREEANNCIQCFMERPQYKGVAGISKGGYEVW